jgi:hypothetical protein
VNELMKENNTEIMNGRTKTGLGNQVRWESLKKQG